MAKSTKQLYAELKAEKERNAFLLTRINKVDEENFSLRNELAIARAEAKNRASERDSEMEMRKDVSFRYNEVVGAYSVMKAIYERETPCQDQEAGRLPTFQAICLRLPYKPW